MNRRKGIAENPCHPFDLRLDAMDELAAVAATDAQRLGPWVEAAAIDPK